jgi:hypothetical protein
MPTKKTSKKVSKKPAAKKTSTSLPTRRELAALDRVIAEAKKTGVKEITSKKPVRGTVAWLIAELKKFPGDMSVLHGDHKDLYYEADALEVLSVREGYIDEEKGEPVVCIRAW